MTIRTGREAIRDPSLRKTWRPMLEWANMTIGGQAINWLWGERDETLRRILPILLNDPRQTKEK